MRITKIRTFLYTTAKILGDIQAVKNGTIKQRIGRRIVGRITGKMIGRLFK